jgi:hypothetical protein
MASTTGKWEGRARELLLAELERKGLGYKELVERLNALGIDENEINLRRKILKGKFSAAFFLQCMEAIGASQMRFDYGRV